jgi:MbtH protein
MDDEDFEYQVLVNHEEQYSLWPTFKAIPNGWRQVGPIGSKQACLDYVEATWTDIRLLSVRRRLAEAKAARAGTAQEGADTGRNA